MVYRSKPQRSANGPSVARIPGADRHQAGRDRKIEELADLAPGVAVGPAHELLADEADSDRWWHVGRKLSSARRAG